ncbi:TRAP transporter small permease [Alcaligenaceae bacterium]|nr:TRAP transporter small permease [Alcaligenaceae bacterium]
MHALNSVIVGMLKAISIIGLCGMSLLTVVDATGRYLFNHPITGSVELVELLMVTVIFTSIPLMTRARGHIVVDSFSHFFSVRMQRLQDQVAGVISLIISSLLAWITLHKAQTTADYGDMTAMLNIPLAPFVYFMALLLALDAIYHAANLVSPASQEMPRHD